VASVFATDKTAKEGETKRWFVERCDDFPMAEAVAKHIRERVDTARWSVLPEYSARGAEPLWPADEHVRETAHEWPDDAKEGGA
jgi:hypothetical protein